MLHIELGSAPGAEEGVPNKGFIWVSYSNADEDMTEL